MQVKIHESYRKIVAVSDSDLVGQKFEEGNRQIDVRPNFYRGEERTKKEVVKILKDMQKEDATFNIVGEESVEAALEAGVISESRVIKINSIPIALVLM
ncbi:DUF424 domain-containing protein [Candidatus Pacearchaeota archaeon]|nr:DUF424 domain-containing protein [Candidatus Pacearchaeota archaeon]